MKTAVLVAAGLVLAGSTARAADTEGSGALALAGLVGLQQPGLSAASRQALRAMLEGRLTFSFPAGHTIKVVAANVACRSSNVDIAHHDCTLAFASGSRTLSGRAAHELYATLIENGVGSDGAAGSIFESVSNLNCTVDPAAVKDRAGGGATCTFNGPPSS
jgi:hypothetical protein